MILKLLPARYDVNLLYPVGGLNTHVRVRGCVRACGRTRLSSYMAGCVRVRGARVLAIDERLGRAVLAVGHRDDLRACASIPELPTACLPQRCMLGMTASVMAQIVMAQIVMAYIVMAYMVMACSY